MIAPYIAAFLLGLVLAVRSMLTGVEKPRRATGVALMGGAVTDEAAPRVRIRTPTLGAFALLFGVVGYLLERSETFSSPTFRLLIASLAGAFAVVVTLVLLTLWARPALAEHADDPRYVLQGTPALVTRPIVSDRPGEIAFSVDGRSMNSPALDFDGGRHSIGDEVVIDRIEDGVAFVESWTLVEQRL